MSVCLAVVSGITVLVAPVGAASTGLSASLPHTLVSAEPAKNTPNILDGTVYSITQVGNQIVVGGQFTQVTNPKTSTILTRNNVFAFDAATGVVNPDFAPEPNGTVYKVQAAADGTSVYIGGSFTSAAGTTVKNLFLADARTGALRSGFAAPYLNGDVRDLEVAGNRLWVAGKFTHVGTKAQKALGTLNATTGAYDPYFTGVLAGLHNPTLAGSVTDVLQISTDPANGRLTAVGNFTSVNGEPRSQIAMFDIGGPVYGLSPWSTSLFTSACSAQWDTYMSDVEFSPDGRYFVVSTGGAYGGSSSNTGQSGCDVVARFEASGRAGSTATWTAYTGGDTTWTVEVTDDVIYTGGHQRWQNNPTAGNKPGQGAVERTGVAALNPVNGMPYSWNPTRDRGVGIQDMLATTQGLYIGSDTTLIGQTVGNRYHARIALMPVTGGTTLPPASAATLPGAVYSVALGGSELVRRDFDGRTVSATSKAPDGSADWATSVGAFMAAGRLYVATSDGTLARQGFDGTRYLTSHPVVAADELVRQTDWRDTDVPSLTSLFYAGGRIYYTRAGQTSLFSRGFEVEDDVVGQQRVTSPAVAGIDYSTVRGAFVADGRFYYATANGALFRADWSGTAPVEGTSVQVSGPGVDAENWASRAMFPYDPPLQPLNEAPVAHADVSCANLTCRFSGTGSTDADGTVTGYSWDFGDGTRAGGATVEHAYASEGGRTITLTVTDDLGGTAVVRRTAIPTTVPDPIQLVATANTNGNRTNHSVVVPASVREGDTMLLFLAANVVTTYAPPAGWTVVESRDGMDYVGRVYAKVATATDVGSTVTVTSVTQAKDDLTLAAYRGVDATSPVAASASDLQDQLVTRHGTPTVEAANGRGWLVSYWADKSSTTTAWTGPELQTFRSMGGTTASSGHMSSLLEDTAGTVAAGTRGGLNAVANSIGRGFTASVLLSGAVTDAPANRKPVAVAGLTGCVDLTCSFSSAGSTDPDGSLASYDWDFGDGSHSTEAHPTHTFATSGSRTVTLTVTDDKGAVSDAASTTAAPTDPPPPVNHDPVAHAKVVACTDRTCTFSGDTSVDGDGDALGYDWDFGDGTPHSTEANPTHRYATSGTRSVTLTVTDPAGASDADTAVAAPSDPRAGTIAHVASASTGGNRTTHAVTVPGSVREGDTLLLFFTANSTTPTYTGPAGWTLLESKDGASTVSRVYTRRAVAADAGSTVRITSSALAKSDLTVAAYRGTDDYAPIAVSTSTMDAVSGTAHVSPAVTAVDGADWLVSYWADRSTDTTAWTAPEAQTVRATGYGTGGGHISALLTDSNGAVGAGPTGALTATANSAARAVSVSVLLASTPPPNQQPVAKVASVSCRDLTCTFSSAGSTDADGTVTGYDWDFGDGSGHSTEADPTHTFTTAGTRTVTLTVSDDDGATATATTTAEPTDPPPPNGPPVARAQATCTDLTCTFSSAGSTDADGTVTGYDWDFGDDTAHSTEADPTHVYATGGDRTVTLTVTDDAGAAASDTVTAGPTAPSAIEYVASAATNGNRLNHSVTVPTSVRPGDTLLLFFTANTTVPTYSGPSGWSLVESTTGSSIVSRVYARTATAGDVGASVAVTSSDYAKSGLLVAAYRGADGSAPVAASAAAVDNASGATHVSPAVTAPGARGWLVTYWADKSSGTTAWTAPFGQSVRGSDSGSGSGHVSALLADSGRSVAGPTGQLAAVANSVSSRGASFSVVLRSG